MRDQELIKAAQAKQQARIHRMAHALQQQADAASEPSVASEGLKGSSKRGDPLDEVELMLSIPEGYGGISQRQRGMTRRAAGEEGPLAAIYDRQEDESEDDLVMLDTEEEEEEDEAGDSKQQESIDDDEGGPHEIPKKEM